MGSVPLDLASLRDQLPGRAIHWFETVDSTMTEAARLAAAGCPSGTAVVTEAQTAGQGRYGRAWHSEKGSGLYASVVLRLSLPSESLPALSMALALATAEAITQATGLACDLRWPNDVLVQGKKCAGVLAQLREGAVVAGIGINVNHTALPDELAAIATSLRMASGRVESRERLLVLLLGAVDRICSMLVNDGQEPVLEAFSRASSFVNGRRVIVDRDDGVLSGVTEGLDPSGFLILRQDDGTRTLILTGGVRPDPCYSHSTQETPTSPSGHSKTTA